MRGKEFLNHLEHTRISGAIAAAEQKTSGEIRVFVQGGELPSDVLAAAQAKFQEMGMTRTAERNAVLIFVVPRARKFAVVGDEGIHQRCPPGFWQELVEAMAAEFKSEHFTEGLVQGINKAAELLARHFPRQRDDRNELPDIVIEE